ncbi:MAG TPA: hypothetical protein VGG28_05325 [Kofleriaceae bacterium]|jgi:hypothetical protein
MMKKLIAALTVAAVTASGCAYTFHPERRGNNGGEIAAAPLVGDILWFIPGIIPGVVFLVVDFTSGAIYRQPGEYRHEVRIGQQSTAHAAPSASAQSR